MTLIASVQSRYSTQRLKELTNDGSPTATSVNTTILQNACDDIEADFEVLSNQKFDSTKKSHISIAVPAVMGKLYEYIGKVSPLANESYDVFIAKCNRLRETNLPGPTTSSNITPETLPDERMDFTQRHFSRYVPYSRGGRKTRYDYE